MKMSYVKKESKTHRAGTTSQRQISGEAKRVAHEVIGVDVEKGLVNAVNARKQFALCVRRKREKYLLLVLVEDAQDEWKRVDENLR